MSNDLLFPILPRNTKVPIEPDERVKKVQKTKKSEHISEEDRDNFQDIKRTEVIDANHILYLVRANQTFIAGYNNDLAAAMNQIKAKTLFLPATNDLLLYPQMAQQAHELIGEGSQYDEIDGMWGHLDGIFSIQSKAEALTTFLEQ